MKRQGSTELPRFGVGALGIVATTSSAQAATVQITLAWNKISTSGGNQLVADLTGDLVDDIGVSRVRVSSRWAGCFLVGGSGSGYVSAWQPGTSGYRAYANFMRGGVGVGSGVSYTSVVSVSYLNAIRFTDSRINGGQRTEGWLQVNAFNTSATNHTVELSRLIFDDASTTRPSYTSIPSVQTEWSAVPEPSSCPATIIIPLSDN